MFPAGRLHTRLQERLETPAGARQRCVTTCGLRRQGRRADEVSLQQSSSSREKAIELLLMSVHAKERRKLIVIYSVCDACVRRLPFRFEAM